MLSLKSAITTIAFLNKWHVIVACTKFYNKDNADKNISQGVQWKKQPNHVFWLMNDEILL